MPKTKKERQGPLFSLLGILYRIYTNFKWRQTTPLYLHKSSNALEKCCFFSCRYFNVLIVSHHSGTRGLFIFLDVGKVNNVRVMNSNERVFFQQHFIFLK